MILPADLKPKPERVDDGDDEDEESLATGTEKKDSNDDEESSPNVIWRKIGGFKTLDNRPFISKDQKSLFLICSNRIRKYLMENGNFLDEYQFGLDVKIVSMQQSSNDDEMVVAFEDGHVLQWNYVENFKINESCIKIDYPTSRIVNLQKIGNVFYYVLNSPRKDTKKIRKCQLSYCSKDDLEESMFMDRNHYVSEDAIKSIAFGPKSRIEYCATIYRHMLHVYEIPVRVYSRSRTHLVSKGKSFTTIMFHPTELTIATGDALGQIYLWNNVMAVIPARSVFHWHSDPVADLAFAPSGTVLYSVGAERVLVKWNLVGEHLGQKNFIPRIGPPMKYVTVDPENQFVVTSHMDHTLQVIDTQMNGVRTVLEGLSSGSAGLSAGLHYNTKLQALALNGRVGHVQFYCPERQKQLFQFDVVQQNIVTAKICSYREKLASLKEKKKDSVTTEGIFPIEVVRLAIINEGTWMATVEYRNDQETSPELRLKFWILKSETGVFQLNTTVHLPHQDEINFMTFSMHPACHLVTTSKDRTFKIWDLNENNNNNNKYWNCSRQATLNDSAVPRMAAFSTDASLISVLFDNILTLWELDSQTGAIRYIPRMDIYKLTKPKKIIFTAFGSKNCSHYLVEGHRDMVLVFNVVKRFETVFKYSSGHQNQFASMEFTPIENVLALMSKNNACIRFLSLEKQIVLFKIDLSNFRDTIVSTVFTPITSNKTQRKSQLAPYLKRTHFYCITEKNELFQAVLSRDFDESSDAILVRSVQDHPTQMFMKHAKQESLPLTLMLNRGITGSKSSSSLTSDRTRQNEKKTCKNLINKYFIDVSAHLLPPINVIEKPFLTSYLECLTTNTKTDEDDV